MSRAGYVLAGGQSTRMGQDKALLPFRGGALAESVARTVELAAGTVAIVGRAELGSFRAIPDRYPGEGPLGGILTALEDTESYFNLVVACDMPKLTPDFLARLLDAADDSDADVLIPIGPAGMPEPLCAVYHRRSLGALERAFRQGVRKVIEAAGEVETVLFPIAEATEFQNVNTPEDWSGHAAE